MDQVRLLFWRRSNITRLNHNVFDTSYLCNDISDKSSILSQNVYLHLQMLFMDCLQDLKVFDMLLNKLLTKNKSAFMRP